ncbi:hypothetical protein ALP96_01149 [Pseudomonas savastanoi pv. glycinea]|nr:hypothetical protein ALP96_01149 [Pseudomonas savastanoi pv. glycinea]
MVAVISKLSAGSRLAMSSIERATTNVSGGVAAQAEPLIVIAIARAVRRRIVNSLMSLSYWGMTI